MTAPAAISAQLVDIRNYATEKCVRLTLHVPTEQMPLIQQAFGWPTHVDPVPVAIARLNIEKEMVPLDTPPRSAKDPPTGADKRDWGALLPSQQAGIRCNEPAFQQFLYEQYGLVTTAHEAASVVREICDVESRKELVPGTEAALKWRQLEIDYRAWLREAEVVPA